MTLRGVQAGNGCIESLIRVAGHTSNSRPRLRARDRSTLANPPLPVNSIVCEDCAPGSTPDVERIALSWILTGSIRRRSRDGPS